MVPEDAAAFRKIEASYRELAKTAHEPEAREKLMRNALYYGELAAEIARRLADNRASGQA